MLHSNGPVQIFSSHQIMSTIMHHMQAFYYPDSLLDYVLHALSAPLFPATRCTKEQQKSAQAAPSLQLPHGKHKESKDALQEGTYQRHFHQMKLAVGICLSTKQSTDGHLRHTRRALCARATAVLRAVGV